MRQFLTESVLLSVLGGVLGLIFSFWLVGLSRTLIPAETLPAEAEVTVNLQILSFAGVVSLLTGLFFGLAPSWSISKTQLTEILKAGARSTSSSSHESRFRSILVISEVALAIMLLVGAGLLVRSWNLLQQVNPGFAPNNVLTLELTLPETKYFDAGKISNFYQGVLQRIKASPDIQQAAIVTEPPLAGSGFWMFFTIEGHPPLSISERPSANSQVVSPGYFGTMSIPILKGRDFTEHDKLGSPSVAIINETIARRFFPNEDPIGKRINIESRVPGQRMLAAATPREIVGVVGNVKIARLVDQPDREVYVPHSQNPWTSMCLVVRTNNPISTVNAVNQAVREIDKTQPVTNIRSMHQIVAESLSEPRFRTLILSAFSVVAFLLSALGIYGVMSHTVSQRTQEIGIRMALGANRREVLRLIVGQGMVLVLVGLIVGVLASLVVNRALSSFLFGVGTADPTTFCAMSLLVLVVAFLACYLPARRAATVDPMVALRCE